MCEWCTIVVDAVSILGVLVYVVVVHGRGSPLDVGNCRGGVVVRVQCVFNAPAGDVHWFVLVPVGKVELEDLGRQLLGVALPP